MPPLYGRKEAAVLFDTCLSSPKVTISAADEKVRASCSIPSNTICHYLGYVSRLAKLNALAPCGRVQLGSILDLSPTGRALQSPRRFAT